MTAVASYTTITGAPKWVWGVWLQWEWKWGVWLQWGMEMGYGYNGEWEWGVWFQ